MKRVNFNKPLSSNNGFTLIEVMIALGVLAVSLVGILTLARESTRNTISLQERIEAHWVANNVLTDLLLNHTSTPLFPGRLQGVQFMGQTPWVWVADINTSRDMGVLQIVVQVSPDQSGLMTSEVTAYIAAR